MARSDGPHADTATPALLEDFASVRELLRGETVTTTGRWGHRLDAITLAFPPPVAPPLLLGAVNSRALRAAGAHADGVLLSVLAGETYVRWASEEVAAGAADAGRAAPPITAFVLASVDDDAQRARDAVLDAVQFFARAESHTSLVSRSSAPDEGLLLGDWAARTRARLIGEFAAAGTPDDVADKLRSLLTQGADSLALWIFPSDALDAQLRTLAERVLPQLGNASRIAS